jgi:plastocyanin
MGKLIGGIVVVLGIIAGIYFWSGSSKQVTAPATPEAVTPSNVMVPATPQDAATTAKAKEITVSGSEFAFQPSTLTLKKGEPVKITFKNTGKFPHNLTLSGFGVASKTINPGEQDTFQFTPDQSGTSSYSCTVGTHADKGMKGTLTVQ